MWEGQKISLRQIVNSGNNYAKNYPTCVRIYALKNIYFFNDSKFFRLPIVDEKAPKDTDFDAMLTTMRETTPETACIFNCQVLLISMLHSSLTRLVYKISHD